MKGKIACLFVVMCIAMASVMAMHPSLEDLALQESAEMVHNEIFNSASEEMEEPHTAIMSFVEAETGAEMETEAETGAEVETEAEADVEYDGTVPHNPDDAMRRYFFFDDPDVEGQPPVQNTTQQVTQAVTAVTTSANAAVNKDALATGGVNATANPKEARKRKGLPVGKDEWMDRRRYSRLDADFDHIDELELNEDDSEERLERLLKNPNLQIIASDEDKGLYFGPSKKDARERRTFIKKAMKESKKVAEQMARAEELAKKQAKIPLSEIKNATNGTSSTGAANATLAQTGAAAAQPKAEAESYF